ncbi:unnamed protein product [Parascedosporium putredinis]|uniref:carbonic anhydrase n=1 Tax=Parascedosporium putredinis TaxID=1442378 RepID=A0A9P1HAD8_9PEZI|nr:unnamed protein product [Parascedosporium putredinis]CAI8003945.1 unnamed protein product [Parascedosporium putredinis]
MHASLATLAWAVFSASQAMASCAHGTHLHRRQEGAVEVNQFGYTGLIVRPLNWVALDTANILCATGTRQSPIDMTQGQFQLVPATALGVNIPDFAAGAEFENLGTTVEVIAQGGAMAINGVDFTLQQFHFHLPSEHLDNGVSRAMEMHMVWESAQGQIAVIGVYIDVENSRDAAAVAAPANVTAVPAAAEKRSAKMNAKYAREEAHIAKRATTALLETVFSSLPAITQPGTKTTTQPLVMSEIVDIINAGELQNYSGSLTTPPCSEGVTWFVSTQSLQVSAATFGAVRDPNLLAINGAMMASPQVQLAAIRQSLGGLSGI